MFQKFLNFIKGVFSRMFNQKSVGEALKVQPIVSTEMSNAIETWSAMYKNLSPWLNKDVKGLNLAASISRELATLVTLEFESEITGSARADYLNEQYKRAIGKLRTSVEYAAAKGGLVFKPYVEGDKISVDFVQADSFFPTAYDSSGNITGGIFVEQKAKSDKWYTRLEYHNFTGTSEEIQNKAYVSQTQSELGREVSLGAIEEWARLIPTATIGPIKKPMFAYFKMPFANNIDPYSPLGVSIYSRAVGLIKEADKQYSRFLWENESGERALYVDSTAYKKDADGRPIFPTQRLYRSLDMAEGFFEDWSPTLRETELLDALDAILKKIEFQCGLAYGTISDPNVTDKTATEIKSSKQRSYATVSDTQKALEEALEGLVYAMDVYTTLYKLAPSGKYEMSHNWSDSIITDTDAEFTRLERMIVAGAAQPYELRMFQFGESEEEAKAKVAPVIDMFGGGVSA